jgi:hypothetical protein
MKTMCWFLLNPPHGLTPVVTAKLRSSPVLTTIPKVYLVSTRFSVRENIKYNIAVLCSEPHPEESIYMDQNTHNQILETISQLPSAEKGQCGAENLQLLYVYSGTVAP